MPVSDLLILGDEGLIRTTLSPTVVCSASLPRQTGKGLYPKIARSRVSYQKVGSFGAQTSLPIPAFDTVAGNTIVVMWRGPSAATPVTVADTAGNSYTQIQSDTSHDPAMRLFVAENVLGQVGNVVTVSQASVQFCWAVAVQYQFGSRLASGVLAAGSGVTDLVTSAVSTAAPVTLLVGASQNSTTSYTAGVDSTLIDGSINATIDSTGFIFGGLEETTVSTALNSYIGHITSSVTNQSTLIWVAYETGSVLTVPTVTKGVGKSFSASVGTSATLLKQAGKNLVASVGTAASKTLGVGKLLSAQAGTSASRLVAVGHGLFATVQTAPTLTKGVGKRLSASVTALASQTGVKVRLVVLSCSVTVTAALTTALPKVLRPVVCVALTATAGVCDTLGLSSLSNSILSLSVLSNNTVSATTASDDSLSLTPTEDG